MSAFWMRYVPEAGTGRANVPVSIYGEKMIQTNNFPGFAIAVAAAAARIANRVKVLTNIVKGAWFPS